VAINNKDLSKSYKVFNHLFFDGRIRVLPENVRFASNEDCDKCDGIYDGEEILINEDLKRSGDYAMITLLHEMVHADIRQNGYIGYEHDGGHHVLFYAGIDRLYRAGAYEGLLIIPFMLLLVHAWRS
jgi:hypothetical protein